MTDLATIERTDSDVTTGQGEQRHAHYVDKRKVTDASVYGTPLVALCGFTWVPSRDPQRYPVCPDCQRIYDAKSDEPA